MDTQVFNWHLAGYEEKYLPAKDCLKNRASLSCNEDGKCTKPKGFDFNGTFNTI